jgi:autophagy-related protein 16
LSDISFVFEGVKTIFAGSSCNDLVTIHGTNILSGHFDKRVRFWDYRTDSSTNEILLQGRLTSLDLSPGTTAYTSCLHKKECLQNPNILTHGGLI